MFGQPLNEAQKAELNGVVCELPIVKELQSQDEEILKDLEGLKSGQETLRSEVEVGFEKGKKRMDGIEGKVDKLQELIIKSNEDRDRQHNELKTEIRDDKLRDMASRLEKAEKQNEKTSNRIWDVAMRVFAVVMAITTAGLLIALNWK